MVQRYRMSSRRRRSLRNLQCLGEYPLPNLWVKRVGLCQIDVNMETILDQEKGVDVLAKCMRRLELCDQIQVARFLCFVTGNRPEYGQGAHTERSNSGHSSLIRFSTSVRSTNPIMRSVVQRLSQRAAITF